MTEEAEPGPDPPGARPGDRRTRAVRSAALAFAGGALVRLFGLLRAVLIARLLVPDEVGRFALAWSAIATVDALSDPALRWGLIQRPRVTQEMAQTVWTAMICRGALLAAGGVALAPLLADVLMVPSGEGLIRAVALTPLLSALQSPAMWLRARDVDLRPQVRLETVVTAFDLAVTVALTAATRSAWGLVGGALASGCARVVGSHLIRGFQPRLRLNQAELADLLSFGGWIGLRNGLWFIATSADDLLVGRFAGTAPLGLYRLAYRIGHLTLSDISETVQRVLFPAFSRSIVGSDEATRGTFARGLVAIGGVSLGVTALIIPLAHDLVVGLLGPRWSGAVGPLQVLAVAGLVRAVTTPAASLFLAAGKPQYETAATALSALVLVAGVAAVVNPFGINGAALVVLAAVVFPAPLWARGLRAVGVSPAACWWLVVRRVPAAALGGAVAGLASYLVAPALMGVAVGGLSGGMAWLAAVVVLDPTLRGELASVLQALGAGRAGRFVGGRQAVEP